MAKIKRMRKGLSVALILALLVQMFGFFGFVRPANAAALDLLFDTMSRHKITTDSDHEIKFKTPTGVDALTDTITITFAAGFDLATNNVAFGDMDLEEDVACDGAYENSKTLAAAPAADVWGAAVSGQVVTLTAPTNAAAGEIAANACVLVEIGDVATGGAGNNQIINPGSAGSYEIGIAGVFGDLGEVDVPIVDDDQVTISGTVDSYIDFDLDTPAGSGGSHGETAAPYAVNLQELSFSSLTNEDTSNVTEIYIDLNSNADDGTKIYIKSLYGATGLSSAHSGDNIASATQVNVVNSVDGNYGVAAIEEAGATEGTLVPVSPFNVYGTANSVGALTTSFQEIFNTNSVPIVDGDGEVAVRAVAGRSTSAADDYTDTLTFRATGAF